MSLSQLSQSLNKSKHLRRMKIKTNKLTRSQIKALRKVN